MLLNSKVRIVTGVSNMEGLLATQTCSCLNANKKKPISLLLLSGTLFVKKLDYSQLFIYYYKTQLTYEQKTNGTVPLENIANVSEPLQKGTIQCFIKNFRFAKKSHRIETKDMRQQKHKNSRMKRNVTITTLSTTLTTTTTNALTLYLRMQCF